MPHHTARGQFKRGQSVAHVPQRLSASLAAHPRDRVCDLVCDSIGPDSTKLNPLIHEPARLAVLSALAPAEYVDFSTLMRLVGVSKSALSKHVAALAMAGIVNVNQSATDKRVRHISLTSEGRSELDVYLERLEQLIHHARS